MSRERIPDLLMMKIKINNLKGEKNGNIDK